MKMELETSLMEAGEQIAIHAVVWNLWPKQEATCDFSLYFLTIQCHFISVSYNSYSRSAPGMRDAFRDYFYSLIGEVSWQYNHVCR